MNGGEGTNVWSAKVVVSFWKSNTSWSIVLSRKFRISITLSMSIYCFDFFAFFASCFLLWRILALVSRVAIIVLTLSSVASYWLVSLFACTHSRVTYRLFVSWVFRIILYSYWWINFSCRTFQHAWNSRILFLHIISYNVRELRRKFKKHFLIQRCFRELRKCIAKNWEYSVVLWRRLKKIVVSLALYLL